MKKYKEQKQYRYRGYNYAQAGFYFITICTKDRERYFGDISIEGTQTVGTGQCPVPTEIGRIAEKCWREIPGHFPFVKLDEFIIMPDHLHGIIEITEMENAGTQSVGTGQCGVGTGWGVGTGQCPVPTGGSKFGRVTPKSISTIIGSYKSFVTKIVNLKFREIQFAWQPRFYDRIIRNGSELNRIRQYIMENPERWESDKNNQENILR